MSGRRMHKRRSSTTLWNYLGSRITNFLNADRGLEPLEARHHLEGLHDPFAAQLNPCVANGGFVPSRSLVWRSGVEREPSGPVVESIDAKLYGERMGLWRAEPT